jgi:hypothetical protein
MSWVEEAPPWKTTSHFVLRGAAKGAVNAVSIGLGWGFTRAPNGTFSFSGGGDTPTRQQFQAAWQGSDAKAAGLRTYPIMGLPGTPLFNAPAANLEAVIADLCAEVQAAGVQGVNFDYEPAVDVRNKTNNPTFADGLAYATFLDKVAKALHKLPSRPILTMDSLSVGSACWSAPPPGEPTHIWDEQPCPWIRRAWNLDAIADTALDVVIPMDTYDSNDTAFAWNMYQYQKFFDIGRIGWGLYPTDMTGAI